MPKKASSDLPDLISSLTKNEAGYFKKFSARHSDSTDKDYLRLFDQLSGENLPAKEKAFKNPSRLKNYLHHSILLSLEVPEEEIVKRILLRGMSSGRTDDNDESIISKRIQVYLKETAIVFEHYAVNDN